MLWKLLSKDPTGGTVYTALKGSTSTDPDIDRLILWLTDLENKEAARQFSKGFLSCIGKSDAAVSEVPGGSDLAPVSVEAPGGADLGPVSVEAPGGADLGLEEEEPKPANSESNDADLGVADEVVETSSLSSQPAAKGGAMSSFDFQLQKLDFDGPEMKKELELVKIFFGQGKIKDFTAEEVQGLPLLRAHSHSIYKEMSAVGSLACKQDPFPKNMKRTSKNIVSQELGHFWMKFRNSKNWKTDRTLLSTQEWASLAIASLVYLFALRHLSKQK